MWSITFAVVRIARGGLIHHLNDNNDVMYNKPTGAIDCGDNLTPSTSSSSTATSPTSTASTPRSLLRLNSAQRVLGCVID